MKPLQKGLLALGVVIGIGSLLLGIELFALVGLALCGMALAH